MVFVVSVQVTNHCSVQEWGNVEDFIQTQGRVDAFVLFASAEKDKHGEGEERGAERGKKNQLFIQSETKCLLPPCVSEWNYRDDVLQN